MTDVALDTVICVAGPGLQCVDAFDGRVVHGVACALIERKSGKVLARSVSSPSGVAHWPDVPPRVRGASEPSKLGLEVLVEEASGALLPLRLQWPLPTTAVDRGAALCRVVLHSAPQRSVPPGATSVRATLLAGEARAAWARVVTLDSAGRQSVGMSDARGGLTLHLPVPRPNRENPAPGEDETETPRLRYFVDWTLAHSTTVAAEAEQAASVMPGGVQAPLLSAWSGQPEVFAQRQNGSNQKITRLEFPDAEPIVVKTVGLGPERSELKLLPV